MDFAYAICFVGCFHLIEAIYDCNCPFYCNFTEVCKPEGNCTERNVALGRPATISSLFDDRIIWNQTSGPACLAVNGDKSRIFRPVNQFPDSPSCIHTAYNDNNPYWEVDLGNVYDIDYIVIFTRNRSGNQLANVTVTVDDSLCYKFAPMDAVDFKTRYPDNKVILSCVTPFSGRRVKLSKESEFIMFCEVEVWANCSNNGGNHPPCIDCGHCMLNAVCDSITGACPSGCDDGWRGHTCDEVCVNGTYGRSCNESCGNCKVPTVCRHDNGFCDNGCAEGFTGNICKQGW